MQILTKWLRNNTPYLVLLLALLLTPLKTLNADEAIPAEVIDSTLSFISHEDYDTATVVGKIANSSSNKLKSLSLEVQLFDASGELIDAMHEHFYSLVVPANDFVAFRIQGLAARAKADYASHSVRILDAEIDRCCMKRKTSSATTRKQASAKPAWLKPLVSSIPIIVFMGLFFWFYRKCQAKGSPQQRIADNYETQLKLQEQSTQYMARIADALDKRAGDDR